MEHRLDPVVSRIANGRSEMTTPPANASARRATEQRDELTSNPHYRLPGPSQAILGVWRQEATRVLSEYFRSGDLRHLHARSIFIAAGRAGGYVGGMRDACRGF